MILLPPPRRRTLICAGRLALAAAISGVVMAPAEAQQQPGLRGAVRADAINEELLQGGLSGEAGDPTSGIDAPPYDPVSEGAALADPLTAQSDVFGDDVLTPTANESRATRTLPVDEGLTTGTTRATRVDAVDDERNTRAAAENQRVGAIGDPNYRREDDPYAPLGLRVGTFNLTSTLEQGIGWTSNATSSPGGGDAVFSETGLRLEAISDWSRHSAALRADGTYRKSLSGEDISEFEGGGAADLRLELGNEYSATGSVGYRIAPESAASPVVIPGTASQPLRHTFTGSAGLAKEVGKLRLGVTGDVVRDVYGDAELSGGGTLSQSDRNSTLATVSLRAGYEISPALTPFVEGEVGRRFYDEELDGAGYARSADRYALRGGVELDLSEKLRGEISAGWLTERPDDDRLAAVSGAAVEGNLAWSPVRGTTVELNGSTTVEGTTTAGESGSLLYSGSLALRRDLRPNLTGRALVGLDYRDYVGSSDNETVLRGEASLTWWMNRYAGITGTARHEVQNSTLPDRDYEATSIYLGLTLQR